MSETTLVSKPTAVFPASRSSKTDRTRWVGSAGIGVAAVLLIIWGVGGGADRYLLFIATQYLAFVIATSGLNILFGYSGQVSLGHGAFFAMGAYGVGWALVNTSVPFVLVLPLALGAVALISLALVGPTLRVRGHFLAMITLAYAIVVDVVIVNWEPVTGGPLGMSVSARSLLSWAPLGETLFVVATILAAFCLLFMFLVRGSALGRGWRSIQQSEVAAACLAVPVRKYRVLAFVISAVLAGLGGVVYGLNVGFLTPSEYDAMLSVSLLLAVIVGGPGRFFGPVLGAAIVVLGPELFRPIGDHRELIMGLILVAFLAFQKGGVAGLIADLARIVRSLAGRLVRRPAPKAGEVSAE